MNSNQRLFIFLVCLLFSACIETEPKIQDATSLTSIDEGLVLYKRQIIAITNSASDRGLPTTIGMWWILDSGADEAFIIPSKVAFKTDQLMGHAQPAQTSAEVDNQATLYEVVTGDEWLDLAKPPILNANKRKLNTAFNCDIFVSDRNEAKVYSLFREFDISKQQALACSVELHLHFFGVKFETKDDVAKYYTVSNFMPFAELNLEKIVEDSKY